MTDRLAELIGRAVLDHPAVVRLDAGEHGMVATYLPGNRYIGVHLAPDQVRIAVVLRLGAPLPDVADQLRELVRAVAGPVRVDIVVTDVVPADEPADGSTTVESTMDTRGSG